MAAEAPGAAANRPGAPGPAGGAAPAMARIAHAKINLTLHLCGQRADGYHLLDSLVAFPALGDRLSVEPAQGLSLSLSGPFGDALSASGDNLVLQAAERLAQATGTRRGAALHLEKSLPVASGIGGGSADAAAALALLSRLWGVAVPNGLALGLGADVPVCCAAPRPQRMQGIGERLTPGPALPPAWIVLVNPLVGVATGAVFAGIADKHPPPGPDLPPRFADFAALAGWLAATRNDLQPSAVRLCPAIADVLAALSVAPVARMSGSGATCFALLPAEAPAHALAERLRRETRWWVAAAPLATG